jgi:hypothetical protein
LLHYLYLSDHLSSFPSDRGQFALIAPCLDKPNKRSTDVQWLSFAAAMSDVIIYIAHDNVFTTDVDFLSVILAEIDHSPAEVALVRAIVVALDTTRSVTVTDEPALWKPIADIPRKQSIHRISRFSSPQLKLSFSF